MEKLITIDVYLKNQKHFIFEVAESNVEEITNQMNSVEIEIVHFDNVNCKSVKEDKSGIDLFSDFGLLSFDITKSKIDKVNVDGKEIVKTRTEQFIEFMDKFKLDSSVKSEIIAEVVGMIK